MALFKISKGVSSRIPTLNRENTQDGWCWFTTDDGLFHIDYEDNGVLQRKTLNANDAKTLTGASMETGTTISESATKIPTSKMVNEALGELRSDIQDNYNAITDLEETKMNKVDPQGSGKVSINGTATGDKAVAFGGTAEGANSFSLGTSTAKGARSFAGGSASAEGSNTFAFGVSAQTTQDNAFAFGNNAKATGIGAVSFGNQASGQSSFAEGSNTIAQGTNSHSAGFGTKASHKSQFVIGEFNTIDNSDNPPTSRGKYAFIIGKGTGNNDRKNALTVTWDGSVSHEGSYAGGNEVIAIGLNSHAEGNHTSAQEDYSHAEGSHTTASGNASHAEGKSTTASGESSHAGGESSIATGKKSFVHGYSLTAEGENQAVFGKYNFINTTDIFQIGGGTSDTDRKNIFSIDTDGDAKIAKSLNIGDLPTDLMAGYSLGVNGYTYFNDFVSVSDNYTPTEDNHLVNRKFVTDNLPNITHIGITATEGQNIFDFSTVGLTDLSTYYLVFYDGLLLMEGMHYNITDKYKVSLLDWTAPAGHMIHVLGFKPIQAASMSYDALELINGSY